jgi:hypothetical protein
LCCEVFEAASAHHVVGIAGGSVASTAGTEGLGGDEAEVECGMPLLVIARGNLAEGAG